MLWVFDVDEWDCIDFIYFMLDRKLKLKDVLVVGFLKLIVCSECVEESGKDLFIILLGVWLIDYKVVMVIFFLK